MDSERGRRRPPEEEFADAIKLAVVIKSQGITSQSLLAEGKVEQAQFLGLLNGILAENRLKGKVDEKVEDLKRIEKSRWNVKRWKSSSQSTRPWQMQLSQAHPEGYLKWKGEARISVPDSLSLSNPEKNIDGMHDKDEHAKMISGEVDHEWSEYKKRRGWTDANFRRWADWGMDRAIVRLKAVGLWSMIEGKRLNFQQTQLISEVLSDLRLLSGD